MTRKDTAPQPVEHHPALAATCPECDGLGWDMDCQNEFRPATCPDCAGSGKAEHSITVQESALRIEALQAERDALREALFEARATMTSALSFEPGINEVTKKALAAEIERIKSLLSEDCLA